MLRLRAQLKMYPESVYVRERGSIMRQPCHCQPGLLLLWVYRRRVSSVADDLPCRCQVDAIRLLLTGSAGRSATDEEEAAALSLARDESVMTALSEARLPLSRVAALAWKPCHFHGSESARPHSQQTLMPSRYAL